jgi:pilus assembly protein CpaB
MDAKKIALLVGALLIAGITAFMAKNLYAGAAAPAATAAAVPQQLDGPEILVATRALPVGTLIEPDSFKYQPWPKDLIQNAYYLKGQVDLASLTGTVVRSPITAGQPVTQGALVKPGDRGFLAAALGPGMRAVSIKVADLSDGVAGFIFPGDRVDIMLTQQLEPLGKAVQEAGLDKLKLNTAETILRNVRVLATDQRTTSEDKDGKTEVKTYGIVTLEVTPKIAEKVAVGQKIGQLTLSLRSIADNTADLERAIASGEVKVPAGNDPVAERKMLMSLASRPLDTGTTVSTGGEVSRFQITRFPYAKAPSPSRGQAQAPAPAPSGGGSTVLPQGPVIRVARGNTVTEVEVGGK